MEFRALPRKNLTCGNGARRMALNSPRAPRSNRAMNHTTGTTMPFPPTRWKPLPVMSGTGRTHATLLASRHCLSVGSAPANPSRVWRNFVAVY